MAELDIKVSDFFNVSLKKTASGLCIVKHCRNEKRSDRNLCHKCNMRLWRARNPMQDSFNNLRNSARKRRIGFSLSFDDFCTLCKATGYLEGKGNFAESLHIDREDNRKGYEPGNICVITCSQNVAKGNGERRVRLANGLMVPIKSIRFGQAHVEDDWVDDSDYAFATKKSIEEGDPF